MEAPLKIGSSLPCRRDPRADQADGTEQQNGHQGQEGHMGRMFRRAARGAGLRDFASTTCAVPAAPAGIPRAAVEPGWPGEGRAQSGSAGGGRSSPVTRQRRSISPERRVKPVAFPAFLEVAQHGRRPAAIEWRLGRESALETCGCGRARIGLWCAQAGGMSVEASMGIRARERGPRTAATRSGSVRMRCSISSPPSARMQIWLSLLWTSMPIWSMAGLPFLRRRPRVALVGQQMPPRRAGG
jgi:hypothetical protein